MNSFSDVIARWKTVADFAHAIDVPYQTAAAMKARKNVPSKYWGRVLAAARAAGFADITQELLIRLSAEMGSRRKATASAHASDDDADSQPRAVNA